MNAVPAVGQLDCFRLLECLLSPCECRASKVKEKGSVGSPAADAFCCEEALNFSGGIAPAGKSLAQTSPGVNRTVATSRAHKLFSSPQRCPGSRMRAALVASHDPAIPAARFMQQQDQQVINTECCCQFLPRFCALATMLQASGARTPQLKQSAVHQPLNSSLALCALEREAQALHRI